MNPLYAELQCLPRVPAEFSARMKELASAAGPVGREVRALALPALDLNELTKPAKSGLTRWEMLVEGANPESAPMKVASTGFEATESSVA